MKIKVGISKRHVHLTKETYLKPFGKEELLSRNELSQPGQYASTETISLKWKDKILENVRIVGPLRNYDQVELSQSDADYLGINPPRRKSGDLKNSLPITLVGPLCEIDIDDGVILALRHVHLDSEAAKIFNVVDDECVVVYKDDKELFKANIKVGDPSLSELHIDSDESIKYGLNQDDEVEIYTCGK